LNPNKTNDKPAPPPFPERDKFEGIRDKRHEPPPKDWRAILTGKKTPPDTGPLKPPLL
jgi:hypothetical protein